MPGAQSHQDIQGRPGWGRTAGLRVLSKCGSAGHTRGMFPIPHQSCSQLWALSVLHRHLGREGKQDVCLVQHPPQRHRLQECLCLLPRAASLLEGIPGAWRGQPSTGNAHTHTAIPVQCRALSQSTDTPPAQAVTALGKGEIWQSFEQ